MSEQIITQTMLYEREIPREHTSVSKYQNNVKPYNLKSSHALPQDARPYGDSELPPVLTRSNSRGKQGSKVSQGSLNGERKGKSANYESLNSTPSDKAHQNEISTQNDLHCSVCNKPLNDVYYSTFGKLYDEEHFCCSLCGEKCQVDECFHHDGKLYCKYHFLKYVSKRCTGCGYPIYDQYIEFPKGDTIECWHTECYGIHKYWHVTVSPESFGLPPIKQYKLEDYESEVTTEREKDLMIKNILTFNNILAKLWKVLYRFEEETANCVSDMFQYLTSADQKNGLQAVALLILKIGCLLKGIESLDSVRIYLLQSCVPVNSKVNKKQQIEQAHSSFYRMQSKIPTKLSTKIMIYLQLLRKLAKRPQPDQDVRINSFISIITSIAQFLKLLIRESLTNSLDYCRAARSSNALLKYLREIEKNEMYTTNPFDYIDVPIDATDSCAKCGTYIKEACVRYGFKRWHKDCLQCSACGVYIDSFGLSEATYNSKTNRVYCARCSVDDPDSRPGFKSVGNLEQLVYLLHIALVRSKTVMDYYNKETVPGANEGIGSFNQQTYIRTLNDVKRLKSRRTSMKISYNREAVRTSRIIGTEEQTSNQSVAGDKNLAIESKRQPNKKQSAIFEGTRSLTLDDISRVVAAEQTREKDVESDKQRNAVENTSIHATQDKVYYSELTHEQYCLLQIIAFALLENEGLNMENVDLPELPSKALNNSRFWAKFKTIMGGKESRKGAPKRVFGVTLEQLTSNWGVDSDLGVGPSKLKIPIVIDDLISSLRQLDMSVEGIFRKNGNIRRLKELVETIDDHPQHCPDFSKENVIQLSALLKKFFRDLPVPLLTFDLYDNWINVTQISDAQERKRKLTLLYAMLPPYHRNVAEVLFSFLNWASSFSNIDGSGGSKMDVHNLSTVIAPNVLYQGSNLIRESDELKSADPRMTEFPKTKGQEYLIAINTIEFFITHTEELSTVPPYLVSLLKTLEIEQVASTEAVVKAIRSRIKTKTSAG